MARKQCRRMRQLSETSRRPHPPDNIAGYIPFEAEAANLFFQLVSSRYERASLMITRNKFLGRWATSSAMTLSPPHDPSPRPPRRRDVIALKGESYRLKGRGLCRVRTGATDEP